MSDLRDVNDCDPRSCSFLTGHFEKRYFLPEITNGNVYAKSQWPMSAFIFTCYRLFWFLFWLSTFIISAITDRDWTYYGLRVLADFKLWGHLLLVVGSAVKCVSCAWYQRRYGKAVFIYKLDSILYAVYSCTTLCITVVYWEIESKHTQGTRMTFALAMSTIISCVYVLSDLLVSAYPIRLLMCCYPMILAAFYVITNTIHYEIYNVPVYHVLNWTETPWKAGLNAVVFIFVFIPVSQCALFVLYWVRALLHSCIKNEPKKGGHEEMVDVKLTEANNK